MSKTVTDSEQGKKSNEIISADARQNQTLQDKSPGEVDFPAVVAEEREYIAKRRESAGLPPKPDNTHTVGLAFSGGGIRSATFNLGVVQALHRYGVFPLVDYLSTVSGGGYLGSSISALMRKNGSKFPFAHNGAAEGQAEDSYTRFLRNHSNYLAEQGLTDYLRIAALLGRGILINLLAIVPLLLFESLVIGAIYGSRIDGRLSITFMEFLDLTPIIALVALVYFLASPIVIRAWKVSSQLRTKRNDIPEATDESSVDLRNRYELSFAFVLIAVAVVMFIEIQPWVISKYRIWSTSPEVRTTVWELLASLVSVSVLASGAKIVSSLGGVTRRVAIVFVGLVGFLLPYLVVVKTASGLIYASSDSVWNVPFSDALTQLAKQLSLNPTWFVGTCTILVVGALFSWFFVDVNITSMHGFYRDRLAAAYLVRHKKDGTVGAERDVNLYEICGDGSAAPYHLINTALNLQGSKDVDIRERNSDFFIFSKHFIGSNRTGYCRTRALEAVFPQMDLMTAMAISAAAASPNMGTFTSRALVILMVILNVRLGYWMPNPCRLSKWLARRPSAEQEGVVQGLKGVWYRYLWRVRPTALLQEMLSRLDEKQGWINVTDGGHIENLGVIELLRRRCRYIIAGDGEADGNLTFGSLAALIRYARLDLGVEIDLPLENLRRDANGLSREHCAIGRITYPAEGDNPPETGILLYIKSSLTGDEDEIINEYRSRRPAFPHESTADQFFDEGQFEAYRSLGFHTVSQLFQGRNYGPQASMDWQTFKHFFDDLKVHLAPVLRTETEFIEQQTALATIERTLSMPEYADYSYEIYPENRPKDHKPTEDQETLRKVFHLANIQLQLMESVFFALDLHQQRIRCHEASRGWMELFKRWSQADSLKRAFALNHKSYSVSFQNFCEDAFGLKRGEAKS